MGLEGMAGELVFGGPSHRTGVGSDADPNV